MGSEPTATWQKQFSPLRTPGQWKRGEWSDISLANSYEPVHFIMRKCLGHVSLIWDLCLSSKYWMMQLAGIGCHVVPNKDSSAVSNNKVTHKSSLLN